MQINTLRFILKKIREIKYDLMIVSGLSNSIEEALQYDLNNKRILTLREYVILADIDLLFREFSERLLYVANILENVIDKLEKEYNNDGYSKDTSMDNGTNRRNIVQGRNMLEQRRN